MPDCKPFSLLCTKNFLALAGAFLVTIAQGRGGLSGGLRGMLGAADVGGARRGGLPALSPADLAFYFLSCPYPPSPFPSGEGGDQGYFMQGASPLASPRLSRRRHGLNLRCRCPLGVAYPAGRRLTLPFRNPLGWLAPGVAGSPCLLFSFLPLSPPLPQRGRG